MAWAFVQGGAVFQNIVATGSPSPTTTPFNTLVTSGNIVTVVGNYLDIGGDGGTPSGLAITDDKSNAYTIDRFVHDIAASNDAGFPIYVYVAHSTSFLTNGPSSISVSITSTSSLYETNAFGYEYSPPAGSTSISADGVNSTTTVGNNLTSMPSGSITTTNSGDLIFAWSSPTASGGSPTGTNYVISGFTVDVNNFNTGNGDVVAHQIQSAAGSINAIWTDTASPDNISINTVAILALFAAGGTTSVTLGSGSFTETGNAITTAYNVDINQGTFTLTGNSITTENIQNAALNNGSFTLTGNAISYLEELGLATGAFTLTGNSITPNIINVEVLLDTGSFILTGNAINSGFIINEIDLSAGPFSLTGFPINFTNVFPFPVSNLKPGVMQILGQTPTETLYWDFSNTEDFYLSSGGTLYHVTPQFASTWFCNKKNIKISYNPFPSNWGQIYYQNPYKGNWS